MIHLLQRENWPLASDRYYTWEVYYSLRRNYSVRAQGVTSSNPFNIRWRGLLPDLSSLEEVDPPRETICPVPAVRWWNSTVAAQGCWLALVWILIGSAQGRTDHFATGVAAAGEAAWMEYYSEEVVFVNIIKVLDWWSCQPAGPSALRACCRRWPVTTSAASTSGTRCSAHIGVPTLSRHTIAW